MTREEVRQRFVEAMSMALFDETYIDAAIAIIRGGTLEEVETAVVHALMPNKGAVSKAAAAIRALKERT